MQFVYRCVTILTTLYVTQHYDFRVILHGGYWVASEYNKHASSVNIYDLDTV